MDEIALVALLVVSVFLFVSNFGIGGAVGGAVSGVLFGLFGLFAYAAPVFMLILVLFSLANKDSLAVKIKIAGFLIASISLSAFCHLLIMSKIPTEKITDIFSYCSQHKKRRRSTWRPACHTAEKCSRYRWNLSGTCGNSYYLYGCNHRSFFRKSNVKRQPESL